MSPAVAGGFLSTGPPGSLESTTLMGVSHTAQKEPGLKNGREVERDFYIRYESIFFSP